MTLLTGLLALVGASLLLWLTLVVLALARKLRRDHRESRSRERRGRYQAVLDGVPTTSLQNPTVSVSRRCGTSLTWRSRQPLRARSWLVVPGSSGCLGARKSTQCEGSARARCPRRESVSTVAL